MSGILESLIERISELELRIEKQLHFDGLEPETAGTAPRKRGRRQATAQGPEGAAVAGLDLGGGLTVTQVDLAPVEIQHQLPLQEVAQRPAGPAATLAATPTWAQQPPMHVSELPPPPPVQASLSGAANVGYNPTPEQLAGETPLGASMVSQMVKPKLDAMSQTSGIPRDQIGAWSQDYMQANGVTPDTMTARHVMAVIAHCANLVGAPQAKPAQVVGGL